ncbi:MAG: hypothetical protein QXW79_05330 [Thermoplasmata archaeon]
MIVEKEAKRENLFSLVSSEEFSEAKISAIVDMICQKIEQGESDGIEEVIKAWYLKQLAEAILENEMIKESVLKVKRLHYNDAIIKNNVVVSESTHTKYEYEGSAFDKINAELEHIKQKEKRLQEIAKNTTHQTSICDEDGEELFIKPALKKQKTVLRFSFHKKNR